MKNILLIVLVLFPCLAQAADKGGNGGDAVVCRNSQGKVIKAELFDFYEGRSLRGITPVESALSDDEYFTILGRRLSSFDQRAFEDFTAEALQLARAVRAYRDGGNSGQPGVIFTNDELVDIPDSGNILLKPNCKIEQLAIRQSPRFSRDAKYVIQAEIVRALSDVDARGLVTHEAIYRAFVISYGAENSSTSRYLNQVISSSSPKDLTFSSWLEAFLEEKQSSIRILKIQDIPFNVTSLEYLKDGAVRMEWIDNAIFLVINKDGKLDLNLSRAVGKVRLIPWKMNNLFVMKNSVQDSRGVQNITEEKFSYVSFGNNMLFSEIKGSKDSVDSFDLMFKIGGTVKGNPYITQNQIHPLSSTQTINKSFTVTLNDDFTVSLK